MKTNYIIKATAANGMMRAFVCDSKEMVEKARTSHFTTPVATAALGRTLTAGAMMASMMKGDKDVLTIKIQGDGPLHSIIVTADSKGNVKGYVANPNVDLPLNAKGKLDVAEAVGIGVLTVIKDIGLKEPYVGDVELFTSEIAEDITYYYAVSEQTPSSVALGVLIDKDQSVKASGGFIIQLMPNCSEEIIQKLEEKLKTIKPVTTMLDEGMTPKDILEFILGDFGLEIHEECDFRFACDCNKDKVEKVLISVGKKELQSMIDDNENINLNCHFCNENYEFSVDELKEILEKAKF